MKKQIKWLVVVGVVVAAAGSYVAVNTRLGVHLLLDVLSEIGSVPEPQTAADSGPLKLTATLAPIDLVRLPESIEQPSGIKHRNGAVYVSTDQTEVFKLNADLSTASKRTYLFGGPLLFKQGSLEGLEVMGDRLVCVGEFGAMPTWVEQGEARWVRAGDTALPGELAAVEFSGVVDTRSGLFATSEDELAIFGLDDGSRHAVQFGEFLKESGDPAVLAFSGIAHADGYFYVLSETHTSVLVVETSGYEVKYVFGIEPCAAADLSVHEGRCFVVVDHNYNEPVEPVQIYDIAAAIRAADEADTAE